MGLMYSVSFEDIAVTAVQDLFQIEAITTPVVIHEITISQRSDVGDSEAEALTILLRFITNDITDDLAAVSLNQYRSAVANLSHLSINETSQLTTGAATIYADAWNIQLPWKFIPTPEARPMIKVDEAMVVDLSVAPSDELTMSGTVIFEEL